MEFSTSVFGSIIQFLYSFSYTVFLSLLHFQLCFPELYQSKKMICSGTLKNKHGTVRNHSHSIGSISAMESEMRRRKTLKYLLHVEIFSCARHVSDGGCYMAHRI